MSNQETVQQIYAEFGRGDIAAILGRLAADVEWEYGINSTNVPYLQPRRGRLDVMKFFEALNILEFHQFQLKVLLEKENIVVALVDVDLTMRATGRRIQEEDEVHIWHFNERGQVIRFRHRIDTLHHQKAFSDLPVTMSA